MRVHSHYNKRHVYVQHEYADIPNYYGISFLLPNCVTTIVVVYSYLYV